MKFNAIYQYLMLLHLAAFAICENYYTVIAPGVIKSNRKYTVAVTLHDSSSPCLVRVSISGRSFNASNELRMQPSQTKTFDFFPPKLDENDYQLLAEGLRGCEFKNQSRLLSDSAAGPKIYIQTDKSVYKPQDLIQFRVVLLDEHTRPLNIQEPIRVEIFDNDHNRVKQFKDITLTKGVFTGKFQLSQQPVMGSWEIKAVLSGKYSFESLKRISVQQYTLPKFSVHIDSPSSLVLEDAKITAEIYGKYTFDRYVEGTLYAEIRTSDNDELIEGQKHHIDGLAIVEFNLENKQELLLNDGDELVMNVMLEEKHTGLQQNVSQFISVHRDRYWIAIPPDEIEFRNNKPFRLRAHIIDWSNGPVWDPETPVMLEHGSKKYKTYLNDEGTAVFEFEPEDDASFTVSFKDSKETLPNFHYYQEAIKEESYCKLKLLKRPRLGKPIEVEVRSIANIPYLVYTVVGHASIVRVDHIKLPTNKKTYIIKIIPSIEMIPTSFLYVHYILNGNFRYEELELRFPLELENQISITAPKQVKPGQEVTLSLKAEPKSYVSILAVDLSVYLLESSYDIYQSNIIGDLNDDRSYVPERNIAGPGILSGLITLTNAHYPIYFQNSNTVKGTKGGSLQFRTKFPETWIFENYEINETVTDLVLNIPDTITTWRITAFSSHDIKGFGVVDGPTDITTFLPFFLSLNLPYAVKRDEVVAIPVTIFNYHNQSLDTAVTLYNEQMHFQFMEPLSHPTAKDKQTKQVQISANGGKTVKFLIKPLKIGQVVLRVIANNSAYNDGVVQTLKVLPEGVTKYKNVARYLSAVDKDPLLQLDIPLDSVIDSEIITLSVGGDFMIPSLDNINKMVNLPTGCGEQNMVNFAPNILILDYLKASGLLSKEKKLVNKAKFFTEIGYQQELSYRHKNGGYSVFGERHSKEASTWLTAYVIRFFIKASKYISIESRIIDSDLEYLSEEQRMDGSFPYTGYLFYKGLQNKYGFTAFVLLTFMEDRKYSRKYQTTIRRGLEFISSNLENIDDVYSLSIIAAALSQAKHPAADKVIEKLQNYRKEDESKLMWWSGGENAVETTAYVLMASLDIPGNHLPALKWLIEQRNSQGGFKTTHDTVVGLEALVKYARKYSNANGWNMTISYTAQDYEGKEAKADAFLINKTNALTLQQHELPNSVRRVSFLILGNGYSLVQLSAQFNVKQDIDLKYFIMKVKPTIHNSVELALEICFTYHALNGINNNTNMVIMEANLPTGFKSSTEISLDLTANDFIQRIESKNDETTMIFYFDKLSTEVKHCVNVEAYRVDEVVERKPAAIVMYDYYNTNRTNSLFYTI